MKATKKSINEVYIEMLKDQKLLEGAFERLPAEVIGNDLYEVNQSFQSFYSTQVHGDDFNRGALESIIRRLTNILSTAKKFDRPEDVTDDYDYSIKNRR